LNTPLSELIRKVAAGIPTEETALEAVAIESLRGCAEIDKVHRVDMRKVASEMSKRLCAIAASIEEVGDAWDDARMDHQDYLRLPDGAGGGSSSSSGSLLPPALAQHAQAYAERERAEQRSEIDVRLAKTYGHSGVPLIRLGQGSHQIDVRA
jgi:hypothetical protein